MLDTLVDAAPRIATAVGVVVVAWIVARWLRPGLQRRLIGLRTPSFGRVFASLAAFGINLAAWLVAITLVFPTVDVATMLGGLGLLGVAAGFAFQDILSNLLAGILLIFRQPFVSGDQIEVDGIKGTVEAITIRETRIRTFDGRLQVVPNKDVYTNAIEVQTDADLVRTSFVVGVGYETDLAEAQEVAMHALGRIDGVADDPAPQAYYTDFGASSINLELRYWTRSRQADIRAVQDRVTVVVNDAFSDADINIPFDIVTLEAGTSFRAVPDGRVHATAGSSN